MKRTPAVSPVDFADFGTLLKYLRRRAQLTQTELAIACGYSTPHISHLENNQRLPDEAAILALFVPALGLENEPELVARLVELAAAARAEATAVPAAINRMPHVSAVRPLPFTPEQRNRHAMLQNVRRFWIEGPLENSLYAATLIELGLKEPLGKVENPWETLLRETGVQDKLLPPGTRILDVFEQLNGKLLILGDPGSGKTTSLLELARDLLVRAEADAAYPIPVVLNLASWSEERKPLAEWLIDELSSKYQAPKKVAREWVEGDALLLLLDGLDEVALQYRDACVQAINAYREEHGFVDIVICSRTADYDVLTRRLRLNGAVIIQPLDDQQIDEYLARLGPELATVGRLLEADTMLRELSRTPLMLSILVLAYRGIAPGDVPSYDTFEAQRKHLFDTYVQRMFKRRGSGNAEVRQQMTHYLSWLARAMQEHGQSIFQIERMQPSLLGEEQREVFFRQVRWVSMVAMAAAYGIPFVLLAFALDVPWWVFAPLAALTGAVFAWTFTGRHWHRLPVLLLNGLCGGLTWGLSVGLGHGPVRGIGVGVATFLIFILGPFIASRIFWKLGHDREHIALPEELHFSLTNVKPLVGLVGSVVGILAVLGTSWAFAGEVPDRQGLIIGVISGAVIYAVWYAFQSGLSSSNVEHHVQPNQGIWAALKNANRAAVGNAVQFLITGLFALTPILGIVPGIVFGVVHGIAIGLTFWFIYGGFSVIQHLVVRRILQSEGKIPLQLAEHLDYAASLLFLRRVGGGYIFIHRYLLEYFATVENA
jgi:transcriptional regulator with XRE-family HTH domain